MGDRFAHQGKAQLRACVLATKLGADIVPVWNKSNREHTLIGTEPSSLRAEADAAVKALGWKKPYHVDADHIRLETVDRFIAPSDFFTIDVADSIGKPADPKSVKAFVDRHPELLGKIVIPQIDRPLETTRAEVERVANKFLLAVQDAGKIYRHIAQAKGEANFITEVSMDETDSPQTPPELLIILAALADEKIPDPDHRAEIHRPFQQGRGLRRRCEAVREGIQRGPGGHRLRRQAIRPARHAQTQRPFRQRQVFHLRADPPRVEKIQRRPAPQDRRHDLAGRSHRPRRSGR